MKKILYVLIAILLISGCSGQATQTEEIPIENTKVPTATFTPVPTATPTPQPTPLGGSGSITYTGRTTLEQLKTDGFISKQLYQGGIVLSPEWSPDGSKLAFITTSTEFTDTTKLFIVTLFVTDATEFNPQEIATYQYPLLAGKKYEPNLYYYNFFVWSPDSANIAYLRYLNHKEASSQAREVEFGINVVSMGSNESTVVGETTFAWDDQGFIYRPLAWSPDSNRLAYTNYAKDKHGLFIVDPNTLEEEQLTTTRFANSVTWHPDGDYILFIEDPSDGSGIPHPGSSVSLPPNIPIKASPGFLAKYDLVAGTSEQLTGDDVLEPVISPDGTMVAYIDGNRVVVLPLEGGDEIEIAYACVYHDAQFNLAWSPDNEVVAFRSAEAHLNGCSFSSDNYGAKVFTMDGAQILFTPNWFGPFAFSPDAHYVAIPNIFSNEIVIGDLYSGEIEQIPANFAGYLSWQPFSSVRDPFLLIIKEMDLLEYLMSDLSSDESELLVIDNSESERWIMHDSAPIALTQPVVIKLRMDLTEDVSLCLSGRINQRGKEWWEGVHRLYIRQYKDNTLVIEVRDGRAEDSTVYLSVDGISRQEAFSIKFLDPNGKVFQVLNQLDEIVAEFDVSDSNSPDFKAIDLPDGIFPENNLFPGVLISPGGIMQVYEFDFSASD